MGDKVVQVCFHSYLTIMYYKWGGTVGGGQCGTGRFPLKSHHHVVVVVY